MLQRFGLSYARKGFTLCFPYQLIYSLDHASVLLLPIEIVFPCFVRENQLHLVSFRSTPLPVFSCAAAERRRLALAGVRNR